MQSIVHVSFFLNFQWHLFVYCHTQNLWFNSYTDEKVINHYTESPAFLHIFKITSICIYLFFFLNLVIQLRKWPSCFQRLVFSVWSGSHRPHLKAFGFCYSAPFLLYHQLRVLKPVDLSSMQTHSKITPAQTKKQLQMHLPWPPHLAAGMAAFPPAIHHSIISL